MYLGKSHGGRVLPLFLLSFPPLLRPLSAPQRHSADQFPQRWLTLTHPVLKEQHNGFIRAAPELGRGLVKLTADTITRRLACRDEGDS